MTRNVTSNGDIDTSTAVYTISGDAGDQQTNNNSRRRKSRVKEQPRFDDPSRSRDESYGTTTTGALLHLMKSSISTGTLAMSNAFKNGGLVFGLIGTVLIGLLCAHCIHLLVVCSQTLSRRTRRPALGFADTAASAFSTGPRGIRAWSKFAREFVNGALFCTYYFGNCVYVILISATFKQVADAHSSPEWQFSIRTWILGLALPLLPLGCIRSLRILVPFSAAATAFILVGLGCTMAWVITGASPFAEDKAVPLPDFRSRSWIAPVAQMPLFFTTILFAMESIGTVLPIENSMLRPEKFLGGNPCGVLTAAMTLVVVLYGTTGFLGYLRFGDATKGSITLNLPDDLFSEAVKIMVALSIIFSYGLQFCVPSEIAWNRLEPWLRERRRNATVLANGRRPPANKTAAAAVFATEIELQRARRHDRDNDDDVDLAYYAMRATMILITFFIAAIVPNLAPIVSLFGAVFFSILGLLCPAIIHLATFWEHGDDGGQSEKEHSNLGHDSGFGGNGVNFEPGDSGTWQKKTEHDTKSNAGREGAMSWWTVAKDVSIICIALIALVSGSYASVLDIIAFYGSNDD